MPMAKDVLKYSTIDNGDQSVLMDGILKMPESRVVNLVIQMPSELFMDPMFPPVLDKYG